MFVVNIYTFYKCNQYLKIMLLKFIFLGKCIIIKMHFLPHFKGNPLLVSCMEILPENPHVQRAFHGTKFCLLCLLSNKYRK